MSPKEVSKHQPDSLRFQRLACAALFCLFAGSLLTGRVCEAEEPSDPYDVLYDVIMTRYGPDGKAYGMNESTPSIFKESNFPFDDRTYNKLHTALDAFAALPQEKIETYSDIRRAIMQRHLWQLFDATLPFRWIGVQSSWSRNHPGRRDAARPKIASLIQRLALTKAQILALPDTRAVTVEAGGFPPQHDPQDALKPFLSPDLYAKDSSWVGIGFADPPSPFHQNKVKFRSAFVSFMRLPGGRTETLDYLARLKPKYEQFPVGTQFALIERAFLISNEGEMILSPLTVSISLRAYLDVERTAPKLGRDPTQSVAEFVMQPRRLIQGHAVMKALGPRDMRYEAGDVDIHNDAVEPFEDVVHVPLREDKNDMLRRPRLTLCMNCHKSRGRRGVRGGFFSDLKESSPEEVVTATLKYKREHETWKTLSELWQADSIGEETQSSRSDQAQRRSGSNDARSKRPLPELRRSDPRSGLQVAQASLEAEAKTADPYDVLYDVIMVRKDSDGNAYSKNEVGPLIYGRSKFPFDDETFPKLTAAMERFNALSQARIEAYGTVKRALLQRHLWAVFDATMPSDHKRAGYTDRRRATQEMLATLIRRVALTQAEIQALPDTLAATIKSGGFPQEHDRADRFKAFLPSGLDSKDSSWVCLGKAGNPDTDHAMIDRWRSTFLQFVRLPGGRKATLEYIKTINDREVFPVGTQFALIDQAFLISKEGKLVLSPIVNSIQLRAYLDVTMTDLQARPRAIVCVTELVMQPEQLKQGKFVMRALGPKDFRFQTIAAGSGGAVDPLEGDSAAEARNLTPTLQGCVFCHERSRAGVRSLGDFMFGDRYADKLTFEVGNSAEIARSVAASKRKDETWKRLQELWQAASENRARSRSQ